MIQQEFLGILGFAMVVMAAFGYYKITILESEIVLMSQISDEQIANVISQLEATETTVLTLSQTVGNLFSDVEDLHETALADTAISSGIISEETVDTPVDTITTEPSALQSDQLTVLYGETYTQGWSGEGFTNGEKLVIVDVIIQNPSGIAETISAESFRLRNADGDVFFPAHLSGISGQPRVASGISGIPTSRQELREIQAGANEELRMALVFYVNEVPRSTYWIRYNDTTELISM